MPQCFLQTSSVIFSSSIEVCAVISSSGRSKSAGIYSSGTALALMARRVAKRVVLNIVLVAKFVLIC